MVGRPNDLPWMYDDIARAVDAATSWKRTVPRVDTTSLHDRYMRDMDPYGNRTWKPTPYTRADIVKDVQESLGVSAPEAEGMVDRWYATGGASGFPQVDDAIKSSIDAREMPNQAPNRFGLDKIGKPDSWTEQPAIPTVVDRFTSIPPETTEYQPELTEITEAPPQEGEVPSIDGGFRGVVPDDAGRFASPVPLSDWTTAPITSPLTGQPFGQSPATSDGTGAGRVGGAGAFSPGLGALGATPQAGTFGGLGGLVGGVFGFPAAAAELVGKDGFGRLGQFGTPLGITGLIDEPQEATREQPQLAYGPVPVSRETFGPPREYVDYPMISDITAGRTGGTRLGDVDTIVAHDENPGVTGGRARPSQGANINSYHVTFDDNGVYVHRPLDVEAPHAYKYNPRSIGVGRRSNTYSTDVDSTAVSRPMPDKVIPLTQNELRNAAIALAMVMNATGLPASAIRTHGSLGKEGTRTGRTPDEGTWYSEALNYYNQNKALIDNMVKNQITSQQNKEAFAARRNPNATARPRDMQDRKFTPPSPGKQSSLGGFGNSVGRVMSDLLGISSAQAAGLGADGVNTGGEGGGTGNGNGFGGSSFNAPAFMTSLAPAPGAPTGVTGAGLGFGVGTDAGNADSGVQAQGGTQVADNNTSMPGLGLSGFGGGASQGAVAGGSTASGVTSSTTGGAGGVQNNAAVSSNVSPSYAPDESESQSSKSNTAPAMTGAVTIATEADLEAAQAAAKAAQEAQQSERTPTEVTVDEGNVTGHGWSVPAETLGFKPAQEYVDAENYTAELVNSLPMGASPLGLSTALSLGLVDVNPAGYGLTSLGFNGVPAANTMTQVAQMSEQNRENDPDLDNAVNSIMGNPPGMSGLTSVAPGISVAGMFSNEMESLNDAMTQSEALGLNGLGFNDGTQTATNNAVVGLEGGWAPGETEGDNETAEASPGLGLGAETAMTADAPATGQPGEGTPEGSGGTPDGGPGGGPGDGTGGGPGDTGGGMVGGGDHGQGGDISDGPVGSGDPDGGTWADGGRVSREKIIARALRAAKARHHYENGGEVGYYIEQQFPGGYMSEFVTTKSDKIARALRAAKQKAA